MKRNNGLWSRVCVPERVTERDFVTAPETEFRYRPTKAFRFVTEEDEGEEEEERGNTKIYYTQ